MLKKNHITANIFRDLMNNIQLKQINLVDPKSLKKDSALSAGKNQATDVAIIIAGKKTSYGCRNKIT